MTTKAFQAQKEHKRLLFFVDIQCTRILLSIH